MTEDKKIEKPIKKRKSRKDNKFAALDPNLNLRSRWDEISDLASYANTLPPEAREWLNAYSNEEICANFNHDGPKLNDPTDATVRSRIYNKNNARNRCVYTQEVAKGSISYLEELDLDNEEKAYGEENLDNTFE